MAIYVVTTAVLEDNHRQKEYTVPVKSLGRLSRLQRTAIALHHMTWPPDLNTVEMIWKELDQRMKEKWQVSAQHRWDILQDSWKGFSGGHLMERGVSQSLER